MEGLLIEAWASSWSPIVFEKKLKTFYGGSATILNLQSELQGQELGMDSITTCLFSISVTLAEC